MSFIPEWAVSFSISANGSNARYATLNFFGGEYEGTHDVEGLKKAIMDADVVQQIKDKPIEERLKPVFLDNGNIAEPAGKNEYKITAPTKDQPERSKYHREIKRIKCDCGKTHSVWVDVYDVLRAFKVTCGAVAHAIKKLLAPGLRGAKNERQDIAEAKDSLSRAIESIDERA